MAKQELLDLIAQGECRLEPNGLRLWNRIKISPERWSAGEYGEETEGFWAVGVIGNQVLWYNEIEEGFSFSKYTKFGHIDELRYEQDELDIPVFRLMRFFNEGIPE
jgi:hypothetical protein